MVAMGPQFVRKSICVGFLRRASTSCLVFFLVASIAWAGSWTVYDLGPDPDGPIMCTVADDKEGGLWAMVYLPYSHGRPGELMVYHIGTPGDVTRLSAPPGGDLYADTYYPWVGANQGKLTLIIKEFSKSS